MAYIGKTPTVGNFVKLDAITASATASYTMQLDSVNFSPESVNHMLVSLNGVIQAPTDSYTISGSTITFASALTASDSIDFIMVYGNVLDIGTPSDNTVSLAKLTASGTKDATTFLRGDNTFATAGETNTPAFLTTLSGVQSIANTTDVTVQFNSTTNGFDTDSGFNTGTYTYTIPTGKGGKYYMYTGFYLDSSVADKFWATKFVTTSGLRGEIYGNSNSGSGVTCRAHMIQNFSAGDTVYVRVYHNFGGAKNTGSGIQNTYFGGFRIAT